MHSRTSGARGVAARLLALVAASAAALAGAAAPARGCDPCAIYLTSEAREDQVGFRVGLAQQFTYFHTLKVNGETVPNPDNERIASSITQLMTGYEFLPRLSVQANLPIISRRYRRIEATGVDSGDTSGLGDMSLLFIGKPLSWSDLDRIAHLVLFAGLELPTGSTSFLKEEVPPPRCVPFPDPNACSQRLRVALPPDVRPHHGSGPPSGIHGHDLTLGSGSVDGILGTQLFGAWDRWFATASLQYAIRGSGAYGYRFANDILYAGGPGAYLLAGDQLWGAPYSLRLQLLLSGESKGTDKVEGQSVGDTGITTLNLGPVIGFAWGLHLATELGAELPVLQNNTQLQIVPDYRLRGGFTWRF